jgi:hypothetical protein
MAVEPHDPGGRLKAPLYGRVLEKDRWTRATSQGRPGYPAPPLPVGATPAP